MRKTPKRLSTCRRHSNSPVTRTRMRRPIGGPVVFAFCILSLLASPFYADEPTREQAFHDRQSEVLKAIAENHEGRSDFAERDRVQFGFHAAYLLAALEVNRRGLGPGTTIAEAEEQLRTMTETGIRKLGTPEDPGAWSRMSLSPALKHAAVCLGFIFHQWHDEIPGDIRENIRFLLEESTWRDDASVWFVNGRISVMAGRLLAGERLGYDSDLWKTARREFQTMYENTMSHGGLEMNCPYTIYHYGPPLLLNKLEDEKTRTQTRIIIDNQLMVAGHLYLTGGGVGTPRARDRSGAYGANRGLLPHYHLFFGEPDGAGPSSRPHLIGAAGDYQPPEIVESFFTDKGDDGYEFWTYTPSPLGYRMPGAACEMGPDNASVSPWHAVMAPSGNAVMAASYGHRGFTHNISMGVWVRDAEGNFQRYYHHHPMVEADTTDIGGRMLGSPGSSPDGWRHEGYDFQRFLWERTLLSIWNPTLEHKDGNVVRTYQETRARIPNLANFGGEMIQHEGWYVGRMDETHIAYFPFGEIEIAEERGDGDWFYIQLNEHSGCIIELATTDEFDSVNDYAEELAARHLEFNTGDPEDPENHPYHVEFDARASDTGDLTRLRLDYYPEKRYLAGEEISLREYDPGFIDSPWIDWDAERQIKTVSREGFPTLIYDIPAAAVGERR